MPRLPSPGCPACPRPRSKAVLPATISIERMPAVTVTMNQTSPQRLRKNHSRQRQPARSRNMHQLSHTETDHCSTVV